MTDVTKIVDKDRPRPRLGDKAIALAMKYSTDEEPVNGTHLEEGIAAQEREITDLRAKINAVRAPSTGIDKRVLQHEFDHLFHDLSRKMDADRELLLNGFNGLRLVLNTFAAEVSGDDVSAFIQDTSEWFDKHMKPIEASRSEAEKEKAALMHVENENENNANIAAASELAHAGRQDELSLEQDFSDGREG